MKTDKNIYNRMVKKNIPPSGKVKNFFVAFCVGGSICTIGQLLRGYLFSLGMDEERVGLLVTVFLIAPLCL